MIDSDRNTNHHSRGFIQSPAGIIGLSVNRATYFLEEEEEDKEEEEKEEEEMKVLKEYRRKAGMLLQNC